MEIIRPCNFILVGASYDLQIHAVDELSEKQFEYLRLEKLFSHASGE